MMTRRQAKRHCQNWFPKFHAENFDIKNAPPLGPSIKIDEDKVMTVIKSNPLYTIPDIAETVKFNQKSVHKKGWASRQV